MSIFSKIVAGEIPCHKVWEDEDHLAFLDIAPVTEGHTLVIAKKETDYIFDLPPDEHSALWEAARTVAGLIKERLGCARVTVAVVGWEVPHVHIHLIPTDSIRDVPFPPRMATDHDALSKTAAHLRGA